MRGLLLAEMIRKIEECGLKVTKFSVEEDMFGRLKWDFEVQKP